MSTKTKTSKKDTQTEALAFFYKVRTAVAGDLQQDLKIEKVAASNLLSRLKEKKLINNKGFRWRITAFGSKHFEQFGTAKLHGSTIPNVKTKTLPPVQTETTDVLDSVAALLAKSVKQTKALNKIRAALAELDGE